MSSTHIKLKFKDNSKSIEFKINDNIVFYGVNGKGKTRVLRTLLLLHKLAKEDRLKNCSEIIDDLNLSELIINRENMRNLFSSNSEFNEMRIKKIYNLVINEISAFSYANSRINNIFDLFEFDLSNSERMRYKRIKQQLDIILNQINTSNSSLINADKSILEVDKLLQEIRFFVSRIKNNQNIFSDRYNEKYELDLNELIDVSNYLRSKLNEINSEFSNDEIIGIKSRMLEYRKTIDRVFKTNSFRYVSSELIENVQVFSQIKEKILDINKKVVTKIWSEINIIDYDNLIIDFNERVNKFNSIISRYDDIKLSVNSDGELKFYKNSRLIEFEKLSSGEKRVIIIFLNLLMFDDNTILIDEPEISLSLNYQSKIVFDLMKYKGKKNIMIATHAPFIYEDFVNYDENIYIEV